MLMLARAGDISMSRISEQVGHVAFGSHKWAMCMGNSSTMRSEKGILLNHCKRMFHIAQHIHFSVLPEAVCNVNKTSIQMRGCLLGDVKASSAFGTQPNA